MGTLKSRSWSHSRQGIFDRCERAFFLKYYLWGEPEMGLARFLGKVKNHEMLSGDCIHWAIALALRNFKRDQTVVKNLKDPAIMDFKRICKTSKFDAAWVRDSHNKPPSDGIILHSDIYGYDASLKYEKAIANIATCLENFENSEQWEFIRGTDWRTWRDIDPDRNEMPTFNMTDPRYQHVKIYAGYDIAVDHEKLTHIIDWKTGKHGNAEEQLTVYAMGLARKRTHRVEIPNIRVQAVWLQNPGPWNPQPVNPEVLARVRDKILDQIALEEERSTWKPDGKGKSISFADRSEFPPSPTFNKCASCNFAMICPEGRAAVEQQAAS